MDELSDKEFDQLIKRCERFYSHNDGFVIETKLSIEKLKELTNKNQLQILYC